MLFLIKLALWGGGLLAGRRAFRGSLEVIERDQQRAAPEETQPTPQGIDAQIRETDRDLALTCAGATSALAGVFIAPPLGILAIPCVFLPLVPLARQSWDDARSKRRLTLTGLDTLTAGVALATGHVGLCALGLATFLGGRRLALGGRRRAHAALVASLLVETQEVWVLRDGVEVSTPLATIERGDRIVLHAGEPVPCDGTVVGGSLLVDQRLVTGESILAEKGIGDRVFSATLAVGGRATIEVDAAGTDTLAARQHKLISELASYEQTVESYAMRMGDASVPPTLAMGLIGLALGGVHGAIAGVWSNCVEVLWVCAPISSLGLTFAASRYHVLIKDGRSLELLGDIDTVVFDKTGTLTLNSLVVSEILPVPGTSVHELLGLAAEAERWQSHPVASAILAATEAAGLHPSGARVEGLIDEAGLGLLGAADGQALRVGSRRLLERAGINIPPELEARAAEAGERGDSVVFVAQGAYCRGAILLQPVVRPEVPALIRRLQARGLDVHILSGDDVGPTAALAEALGIRTWQARALPEDKAEVLRALRAQGRKVFLVGDGVNDALAMREATVSAAMGGGSSLAMQSAQILLHEGNLEQLDALFDLGRRHQVTRQRLLDASVVPTLLSFGGVIFAGVGVIGATGIYIGAMGVGLVLALRDGTWTPPSQERASPLKASSASPSRSARPG